jgi:hypothetical protein
MGDVIKIKKPEVVFQAEALCPVSIERVELFNGERSIEIIHPYDKKELGNRIRVHWEGANCRGGERGTIWDGTAELIGNRFKTARPINFYNPDRSLKVKNDCELSWCSLTAGGFSGFELELNDPQHGVLSLETKLIRAKVQIKQIGLNDLVFDTGGLGRKVRFFRLPDQNPYTSVKMERKITLQDGDNPIYVKVIQENGHVAWSSPIYLVKA